MEQDKTENIENIENNKQSNDQGWSYDDWRAAEVLEDDEFLIPRQGFTANKD